MAKVTDIKFDHQSFEGWRKKKVKAKEFPNERIANLAIVIGKNLKDPAWKQSPAATKIMHEMLAELRAALTPQ